MGRAVSDGVTVIAIRPCLGADEYPRLAAIWRSAVVATHHFLDAEKIDYYGSRMSSDYLPSVEVTVAGIDGVAVGFSGTTTGFLAMLFVEAGYHGQGVGTALLREALDRYPDLHLDVNEQNPGALAFYQRHGFRIIGRSPVDDLGDPYPLLHLAYAPASEGQGDD